MSRPQRNDPCPCGSGKKYKACCMERDRITERTLRLMGGGKASGEVPWNPIAREAGMWEADVVPLATGFKDDPDAAPALSIVGAEGFILIGDVIANRPVDVAGRAQAVANAVLAAGRQVGVLPPTLHVRDQALAEALAPELAPRGIAVSAAPMPELDDAIQSSLSHLAGDGAGAFMTTPDRWSETEATPAEIAALHAAAAAFYRAAPWEKIGDEPVVMGLEGTMFLATVMGGAGIEFGLSLHSDFRDVEDMFESDDIPLETVRRMQGYALSVSFERRSRLSRAMQREVAAAGWEIAGPAAYPMIFGLRVPSFRVTCDHVRIMTTALAAATLAVEGEDAPAVVREICERTGVQVRPRVEEEPSPWPELEEAHAIGPVGRNADPEAVLRYVWSDEPGPRADLWDREAERIARFEAWLGERGLSKAMQRRHLRNARVWSEYLAAMAIPAESATEFDLRSYLYDWFPRKESVPRDVERVLDQSLAAFFGWLEIKEEIGYPWAAAVLEERAEVSAARGEAPAGAFWEQEVQNWRGMLWQDLEHRAMLHDRDLPGTEEGWPTFMNSEITHLRSELQRRWLIWYDEAVHGGTTDLEELYETLALRQRGWENTPHPRVGGRTPRQVVSEYEREQAGKPRPSMADFAERG